MRQKFVRHYRRMLPLVLEHLTFRSENRFQPVIEALAVIKQSLGTKGRYLPADVPVEGVVLPSWRETVIESHDGTTRINRPYYEMCVLQRLERALKCKEIWVEGAYAFRNPSQDLPANWSHEDQRRAYYGTLQHPLEVTSFLDPWCHRLTQALTQLNRDLGELAQYLARQRTQRATYLFETNRHRPYSTRRLRQIVKHYALKARITKRVYPHLFRHQLMTYLTKQGMISPKLQLLSGHRVEQSLAVYRALALTDVAAEYEAAMRVFPVR